MRISDWSSDVCSSDLRSFLGRASAASWRRRIERRAGAHVFGNERGVLTHPVAGALDLDDDGVVQQPVEQRGGDNGFAEDLTPFGEAAIGSEDHGAFFVTGVDEQIGRAPSELQSLMRISYAVFCLKK